MADLTGMMQAAAGSAGDVGSYVAVGLGNLPYFVLLDNTTPGELTVAATYNLGSPGNALRFTPDGNYIAIGTSGAGFFTLLDHTTPGTVSLATTYNLASGNGVGVTISPDGAYIAVGTNNTPHVTLLNHAAGTVSLATTYVGPSSAFSVSFSPSGDYIGFGHFFSGGFTVLDHTTPGTLSFLSTYNMSAGADAFGPAVNESSFSLDDNYIAAVSSAGGGFTLLNNTSPGTLSLATTYNLGAAGTDVAFSPDGDYIAAAISSGTRLLDYTSPGAISFAATYGIGGRLSWRSDSSYIAVGNNSGRVTILDHTTPGSLSFSVTYNIAVQIRGIDFQPLP